MSTDIDVLPDEMVFEIFSFLPSYDLIRCSATCKQFYDVSMIAQLWEERISQEFISTTDEDAPSETVVDPRTIYNQRMTDLTHWSQQFERVSNLNHIKPMRRLWVGLKPIYKLLFHSLPTSFLLPKHLNKNQLENHLNRIYFIRKCTRGALNLLSLLSVIIILIFFLTHVSITYRLEALIVLVLLTIPTMYDSFYGISTKRGWMLGFTGTCIGFYTYILTCTLALNADLDNVVSYTSLMGSLLYINGFLVALDISVAIMLFGTINVKLGPGDNYVWPGSGLFTTEKGENAFLDFEHEKQAQVSRLPIVPLAVLLGFIFGTGGFYLIVEVVILVVLLVISWLVGGSVRLSGDLESIVIVVFSIVYSTIAVFGTIGVLEHKMAYCWLLNRHRKSLTMIELIKQGGKLAMWQLLAFLVLGLFIYSWSFVLTNTGEMLIYLPIVGTRWRELRDYESFLVSTNTTK